MDTSISEHLYNKETEVYFGGRANERLGGSSKARLSETQAASWF